MKRPAFQFYPADWRKDVELQSCSMAAQGLWINLMCIAHECEPYGHLTINGKAMNAAQIGRQVGLPEVDVDGLLTELMESGVARLADTGALFSLRMVKDEKLRNLRAQAGGKGGNPDLVANYNAPGFVYVMRRSGDQAVKIGISVDPAKRLYKVRQQLTGQQVDLLSKHLVEDMGTCEAECHKLFSHARLDGEWFKLTSEGLDRLCNHLKAKLKANPTPSSSSSSSASAYSVANATDGAGAPPSAVDVIFANGIPLLTASGVSEKNARSMLGLMRKTHGDSAVVDALARMAEEKPLQPVPWLQAALKAKARVVGKHAGFASKDYRQGVLEDGSIEA